jgi:cytochrome c peroxidase
MKSAPFARACAALCLAVTMVGMAANLPADVTDPNMLAFDDASGQSRTLNLNGAIDLDNPFFQDIGTNGRRCVTCHQPSAAWTITPANVQARFAATGGDDPIFRNNDGSNCEGVVATSVAERQAAYSLLLTRGLIRVGLDVPANAEFAIEDVTDPNSCGPATNDASLYRRPLPSANVSFLSAVMWDGRESTPTTTIAQDLAHQANSATRGHAQSARDLTAAEAQQIVDFETALFTTQDRDAKAGNLNAQGARGGPKALSRQSFFIGINDPVLLNPTGAPFDHNAFTLFDGWAALTSASNDPYTDARRAIARGQKLFNSKPITITGVAGLNGQTFASGVKVSDSLTANCTICHDSPNVGNHSVKAPLNIGVADPERAPYLPVYRLRNLTTGAVVRTTDPGRAMITGKWADVGKFKGPILRGVAARAPYFHNGMAATLEEVVDFYDTRFNMGLTAQEKSDLVAFLRAL